MAEARPIGAHLPSFPLGSAYVGTTLLCLLHHPALTYASMDINVGNVGE